MLATTYDAALSAVSGLPHYWQDKRALIVRKKSACRFNTGFCDWRYLQGLRKVAQCAAMDPARLEGHIGGVVMIGEL